MIGGEFFFGPRSIFDQAIRGQRTDFRKIGNFFNLTLARARCFFHNADVHGGRGGVIRSPARFETKGSYSLAEKPADCSPRVLAIGCGIFGPRSIFDPVFGWSKVKFSRNRQFSTLLWYISKSLIRSDIKLSPVCSTFNFVQPYVLFNFLG